MIESEKSPYVATTLQTSIISGRFGGYTLKGPLIITTSYSPPV